MARLIPEEEVSVEALDGLFRRAFFKARVDEDGDLYVTDGLELPIWIRVEAERKLLRFFTFIERDQDPPSTAELANRLNTSVVLPVFYVSAEEPGRLSANHFLSFEDGIIDSHVIRLARRFAGAFIYGAHKLDEPVLH